MELWQIVVQAFWIIAPAYAANAFPPLVNGRRPLDFGRNLGKYRILGDGKTFEGTIAGILFGVFFGSLLMISQNYIPNDIFLEVGLLRLNIVIVSLLAVGAIFGDIVGTFIKRRLGLPRGAPAPLLDQLDFLTFAILFLFIVYIPHLYVILFLIVVTPIVHWIANLIGYIIKVKRTPW